MNIEEAKERIIVLFKKIAKITDESYLEDVTTIKVFKKQVKINYYFDEAHKLMNEFHLVPDPITKGFIVSEDSPNF